MSIIRLRVEWSPGEFTTYIVTQAIVPDLAQVPGECDAFIVVVDAELLSEDSERRIAAQIVQLDVDWVETIGPRCEHLHDLIDAASVSAGRQEKIGDGNPMTAWHENLTDLNKVLSYVRTGGLGFAETKIVVVIGSEQITEDIASKLLLPE
jgi:hypothetical protein